MKNTMKSKHNKVEPIDEDEQEDIIVEAVQDFEKQTTEMSKMLKRVYEVAAIVTIVSNVYHTKPDRNEFPQKNIVSYFSLCSSFLHFMASRLVQSIPSGITRHGYDRHNIITIFSAQESYCVIGTIICLLLLTIFYILDISDEYLWVMAAFNLMTMGASTYFVFDTKKTLIAIKDLKSSKYKFKTL